MKTATEVMVEETNERSNLELKEQLDGLRGDRLYWHKTDGTTIVWEVKEILNNQNT